MDKRTNPRKEEKVKKGKVRKKKGEKKMEKKWYGGSSSLQKNKSLDFQNNPSIFIGSV